MSEGVITVGGKKFAVGLYWQVSDSTNATKEAKVAAQQPGATADFFCVRASNKRGRAAQFGLGDEKNGHKWNMPSAAVTLANRQPGSWVGVFVVPEGVWFIEVRDDLIAPEGDKLFPDEAAAMERLQEASAQGGLERIYAPPSWGLPAAEGSSLTSLLTGAAEVRLQPVKIPPKLVKQLKIAAAVVAVLVALLFVYFQIQASKDKERMEYALRHQAIIQQRQAEIRKKQEEEKKRQELEEQRKQQQMQALQLPSYQKLWEQSPRPMAWITACYKAMDNISVAPLGWEISSLSCTGSQVLASWSRVDGPADIPPHAQVDPSLRSATAQYDLPPVEPRGTELLWPSKAITLYILRNNWQATISYLPDDAQPTLPDGQRAPPPAWVKRRVNWSVPVSPWTLKGPLVDLPGFILETMTWSKEGSWQIEGVIYEQRD